MKLASLIFASALFCATAIASEIPAAHPALHPRIHSNELLLPANYRNWVVLSPSTPGLPRHQHKHLVSRVYVEPNAFEKFTESGQWPNKTTIVLELISKARRSKSEIIGLEAAFKNEAQFPDPWTYYGIVYDRAQDPLANVAAEEPIHSMLAMAFPTLRAVINAKPSAVSQQIF